MADENPYAPVPMNIPADHPMLDASGFTDLRALGEAGPSAEQLAAALAVIKATGYTVAEAEAAHQQSMATLRTRRDPAGHRCHRCDAPATRQWQRRADADEAEAWHAAREQHIRAHNDGRPESAYVSDRTDMVLMAVHGCDGHDLSPAPDEPVDDSPEELARVNFAAQDAGAALRVLMHDADCGGHGACECGDAA